MTERPKDEMTTEWKFGLGDECKDVLTGMQGIISARIEWIDGCRRYLLQVPKPEKNGDVGPEKNIDEGLLVLIKAKKVQPVVPKARVNPPAGPQTGDRAATRRSSVSSASR